MNLNYDFILLLPLRITYSFAQVKRAVDQGKALY